MNNPTTRFSTRVDNYVKYRPGYPPGVLRILTDECGFTAETPVADVGSGTGILSRVLLENGNPVFGVEPNAEMRAASERLLSGYSRFRSVDGTAEATTLPRGLLPLITVAQALHWFEPQRTRAEFARILQPGGSVAVLWNERRLKDTPFQRAYEQVLQTFGTDYAEVRHTNLDLERVRVFFASDVFKLTVLENRQVFDFKGLRGRLLSSSYAPDETQPTYIPMLARLEEVFDRYQTNGGVTFDYDLNVYTGRITPA